MNPRYRAPYQSNCQVHAPDIATLTGRQCGIFYGGASAANGSPATHPGSVICEN